MLASNASQHRANLKRFAKLDKTLTDRNVHVDARFDGQDAMLKEIRELAQEARDFGKATNGRVTKVEDIVFPMNSTYQNFHHAYVRFKVIAGLIISSPIIVLIIEHLLKLIWK
jgi:hypothetical protein